MKTRRRRSSNRVVAGFAWYRPEQWSLLREVSSDSDSLETEYEDWLASAERWLATAAKAGVQVVKVDVDVEDLVQWCRDQDRPVDGKARSEFAAHKVSKEDSK